MSKPLQNLEAISHTLERSKHFKHNAMPPKSIQKLAARAAEAKKRKEKREEVRKAAAVKAGKQAGRAGALEEKNEDVPGSQADANLSRIRHLPGRDGVYNYAKYWGPAPINRNPNPDGPMVRAQTKLLSYLLAFINGDIPSSRPYLSSPEEKNDYTNVLGDVIGGSYTSRDHAVENFKYSGKSWYLGYNNDLQPHRWELQDRVKDLDTPYDRLERTWRNIGAEIISPHLDFSDEETWIKTVKEVERVLRWSGSEDQGAWMVDRGHLHVRFGFEDDDEMSLATAKNLLSMYSLYETEIEKRLPMQQRCNPRIRRLREGMGLKRVDLNNKNEWFLAREGERYNQTQFTDNVQEASIVEQLKTVVTGLLETGIRGELAGLLQ